MRLILVVLGKVKVMKTLKHSDELIDLGAISTETRGLEPIGKPDVEQGDHYPFGGGAISADD